MAAKPIEFQDRAQHKPRERSEICPKRHYQRYVGQTSAMASSSKSNGRGNMFHSPLLGSVLIYLSEESGRMFPTRRQRPRPNKKRKTPPRIIFPRRGRNAETIGATCLAAILAARGSQSE